MPNKFSFNNIISSISKMILEEEVIEKKSAAKDPRQKAHDEEIQNAILVLASEVIKCNRNFTSETENFIHDFLCRQFGKEGATAKMKAVRSHLEIGTEPFIKMACKELKMLTTHDSRLSIVNFLFGVANADDFVNAKELRCVHRLAGYLGIADKDFKELKQNFTSKNNPYSLLGLDDEATFEEVKTAYRKMVLKFHPDKRKEHVTEEEASLKFREIQRAFEVIKEGKENQ